MDESDVLAVTVFVSLDKNVGELPLVNFVVKKAQLFVSVLTESDFFGREFHRRSRRCLKLKFKGYKVNPYGKCDQLAVHSDFFKSG
jgi:hypothetical protein